jgi:hypothetical protein
MSNDENASAWAGARGYEGMRRIDDDMSRWLLYDGFNSGVVIHSAELRTVTLDAAGHGGQMARMDLYVAFMHFYGGFLQLDEPVCDELLFIGVQRCVLPEPSEMSRGRFTLSLESCATGHRQVQVFRIDDGSFEVRAEEVYWRCGARQGSEWPKPIRD